jgi:hypothetical protein
VCTWCVPGVCVCVCALWPPPAADASVPVVPRLHGSCCQELCDHTLLQWAALCSAGSRCWHRLHCLLCCIVGVGDLYVVAHDTQVQVVAVMLVCPSCLVLCDARAFMVASHPVGATLCSWCVHSSRAPSGGQDGSSSCTGSTLLCLHLRQHETPYTCMGCSSAASVDALPSCPHPRR